MKVLCRAPGCGLALVSQGIWDSLPPERRVGRAPRGGYGLCRKHYRRMRRHGSLESREHVRKAKVPPTLCAGGCGRLVASEPGPGVLPVRARGRCSTCYGKLRTGPDFEAREHRSAEDVLDEWAWLRETDGRMTVRYAAERIGMSPATLAQALRRARLRGDERVAA